MSGIKPKFTEAPKIQPHEDIQSLKELSKRYIYTNDEDLMTEALRRMAKYKKAVNADSDSEALFRLVCKLLKLQLSIGRPKTWDERIEFVREVGALVESGQFSTLIAAIRYKFDVGEYPEINIDKVYFPSVYSCYNDTKSKMKNAKIK